MLCLVETVYFIIVRIHGEKASSVSNFNSKISSKFLMVCPHHCMADPHQLLATIFNNLHINKVGNSKLESYCELLCACLNVTNLL